MGRMEGLERRMKVTITMDCELHRERSRLFPSLPLSTHIDKLLFPEVRRKQREELKAMQNQKTLQEIGLVRG